MNCSYCRISKNYVNKPNEYKDLSYFYKNEISTEDIISTLYLFKRHNPDIFHIFYGGEPLLRDDLAKIINYCNDNDINYTLITNYSGEIKSKFKELLNNISYLKSLTVSIDPIILSDKIYDEDIFKKSLEGFFNISEYVGYIDDLVAEITVTKESLSYLYPLVKILTRIGINSDITFLDISKNNFYDFSNITSYDNMVFKSSELCEIFEKMMEENLSINMRDDFLPIIFKHLPSNNDCKIDEEVHNITIDSDGSIRLCLRIMGIDTPKKFNIKNLLDKTGTLNLNLKNSFKEDKNKLCEKCNWTCMIHSKILNENDEMIDDLLLDLLHKN